MTETLTPAEQGRLLGAAVEGVAWALIESETDTSDRGVSDEHYRDAVRRAEQILPTLMRKPAEPSPCCAACDRFGDDGDPTARGCGLPDCGCHDHTNGRSER